MKRKASDRLQIQSPPLHRPHGLRRTPDSLFPVTSPPKATDISCNQGVDEFTNPGEDNRRLTRTESDDAKTSEYAFFKKLKEDASHKRPSCSKSKEACQARNPKPTEISRERTNVVRDTSDGVRSSALDKSDDSHALPGSTSRNSELKRTRGCAMSEDLHRKQKCMVEETENILKCKGKGLNLFEEAETEDRHADVFHKKRQRLLQWVRETSFPEIDDLCLNGSDLVSVLLSRLFPKSDENNNFQNPKLMKVVPDDRSIRLPSLGSDIHFKELKSAPTKSFRDLGCDPYSGDCTLSFWSKRSREMVSSSYSPTSEAYKNHLDYMVGEPDTLLLGQSAILCSNRYSSSILPFEEYGSVTSGYVKESDMFYQPHEYMVGREPCTAMLGWDFDRTDEKRNLYNLLRYRSDSELLGSSTMSFPMIESDGVLPFSSVYGSREPSHVKELDVIYQPNEYVVWKGLCAPMLGWNFDSTDEERNTSGLSRYRTDSELLGETAMSCPLSDADYVLPFKEYGLMASSHAEEMDVLYNSNEYLVGREPACTLMLGWDFDTVEAERNSSNLSRHTAEQCISNYHSQDVEKQYSEGKSNLQSDFRQMELPLTLSCIPTYLNRARDSIDDRVWEGGTTFFSLQNDHWFRQNIINEGHPYPNAESLLQLSGFSGEHYSSTSQALQFSRGEISSQLHTYDDMNIRCLKDSPHERTLTHFIKDNVNILDSSTLCLQISLDRQKALPLGLGFDFEKPSLDGSERKMNFDGEDKFSGLQHHVQVASTSSGSLV